MTSIDIETRDAADAAPGELSPQALFHSIISDDRFDYQMNDKTVEVPASFMTLFTEQVGALLRNVKLLDSLRGWANTLIEAGVDVTSNADIGAIQQYQTLRSTIVANLIGDWSKEAEVSMPAMDDTTTIGGFAWRVSQAISWIEAITEFGVTIANQRQFAKTFPHLFTANMSANNGGVSVHPALAAAAGAAANGPTDRPGTYL